MTLWQELADELESRASRHLRRELRTLPGDVFDLASNDYLGLATHSAVIEGAVEATRRFGAGAKASRLVSGNSILHRELEATLAQFKGTEAALVFPSGYHANLGTIAALAMKGSFIACHKRNHASLIDACRLVESNGARVRYFDSYEKLEQLLAANVSPRQLVIVDGVFSMDGDLIDLPSVLKIATHFDAYILLDDAHGTGTLGARGRGVVEYFGIHEERIIQIGTLSKALGSQGGFVAGPQVLIDYLVNAARPFIYTTGLNPPAVGAALAAIQVLVAEPERVSILARNLAQLAGQLNELGMNAPAQPAPILPVILGDAAMAVGWSRALLERGFWCPPIRPPTVAAGTARLRLTASAAWNAGDIQRIVEAFKAVQISTR